MALVGVSELLLSYCDRRGMTEIGPSEWRSLRQDPHSHYSKGWRADESAAGVLEG